MAEISFNGRHFQHDMILQSVRWYLAYALSYRGIEEIMQERAFDVDHSTIHRWVVHYSRSGHDSRKNANGTETRHIFVAFCAAKLA
jgi:transposase-like protein